MYLKIGKAVKVAAELKREFTSKEIGDLVAPLFENENPAYVQLKVNQAIRNYLQRGSIQSVKAGSPHVPGTYRWAAALVTLAFTLTCLTAQTIRIFSEPGHVLLQDGATINVSADAQSGTLGVEMDCEPASPTNLTVRLEL